MWQINDSATTTDNYCSHLHADEFVAKTKESEEFEARNTDTASTPYLKFDGKHKCTYIFWTQDTSYGLGFKVTQSDFSNYELQWNEWNEAYTTSGFYLPAADSAAPFAGVYDSGKLWPNPMEGKT